MDWIAWLLTGDWANLLLFLAVVFLFDGFVFAMIIPIFGGPWTLNREMPRAAWTVGWILASVPLGLYILVWIGRGILWLSRAAICPC